MSLFVCEACGGVENTATSRYWLRNSASINKGESRALCWNCDPNILGRRGGHIEFHGQLVLNPEVAWKFLSFAEDPELCEHNALPDPELAHVGAQTLCMDCGALATVDAPEGASGERGTYAPSDKTWEVWGLTDASA